MIHNVLTYLREAAKNNADKTAFFDSDSSLTYGELWRAVRSAGSAVARLTGERGRQPIFVLIGRDVVSVAACLSVAAAGCFYVPVDPSLPEPRLCSMTSLVKPALVIRTGNADLPFDPGVASVSFGDLLSQGEDSALIDNALNSIRDTDPLYCIFTSGSTGVPKGVLVSHRSVINMVEQFVSVLPLAGDCVFGNQAPFDFDVSVKDVYLSLKLGGTVRILERQLFSMPKRLIEVLNRDGVNTLIWSVSAMKIVSAMKTFRTVSPEGVRLVMFSGEALPARLLGEWKENVPGATFVNLYGPTEITCNCTYYIVDRTFADDETIPIGKAFPNMGVFLLDGDREVVSQGETGEICVTGAGLSLGYFGDSGKTTAAFPNNPLEDKWEERMYRTGDLGKLDGDGNICFVGRADSQVKYMGFRIELGEIETAAQAIPFVDSACCVFDEAKEQLCLAYQSSERDDRTLVGKMKETLPVHMIPRRIMFFESLPVNRTGKPDRAAIKRLFTEGEK
ncbi:MAG: amino acid adenylation domain-containing protein [Clostridia bacterium]|nr:amino acid adenylation domain-containing protein [Clostridia bacterium]